MTFSSEQLWESISVSLQSSIGQTWDIPAVAHWTGSTPRTVVGWLAKTQPVGERLIKLWHILAALGMSSPELEKLPEFNRYLGELFSLSVITISEVQEILSVKSSQTVLMILRGQSPSLAKLQYSELIEMYDEQLQAKKQELLKASKPYNHERGSPSFPQSGVIDKDSKEVKQSATLLPNSNSVTAAAVLVGALLPLLRILVSDTTTSESRSLFREIAGNEIFEGSNLLGALCSERARKQMK